MSVTPPKVQNVDVDVPIEEFGGLITELTSADIPLGASPFCQDVDYQLGAVFTRAGLIAELLGQISANTSVNYLKTFTLPNTNDELLILDNAGVLSFEDTTGAPGTLNTIERLIQGSFCNSVTQFGREWFALNDGLWGSDAPRQWDGTNFDRVSQDGPGAAPTVTDENNVFNIHAAATGLVQPVAAPLAAPNGLSINNNVVTMTLAAAPPAGLQVGDIFNLGGATDAFYNGGYTLISVGPGNVITASGPTGAHAASGGGALAFQLAVVTLNPAATPFVVGQSVTIAGAGVAGYNSAAGVPWIVRAVNAGVSFTVAINITGLAASGGGTATTAGSITAGVHKIVQIFLTREGYLTAPSPIGQWTAAGNFRGIVNNLAIGPANVVARWLAFTATGGGFFFVIPIPLVPQGGLLSGSTTGTVVNDNTSFSFIVDFTDVALLNSFSIDSAGNNLFNLVVLGPAAGVISYSQRMFWWGERNKIQNFLNMGFDGGFDNATNTIPLGWVASPTSANAGAKAGNLSLGFAYQVTMAGVPATPYGQIQQPAFRDGFQVAILQPSTFYTVRARTARTNIAATASLIVDFFSPTAGVLATASPTIPLTGFGSPSAGALITGNFNAATPAVIPADTVMRLYVEGGGAASIVTIDELEIFPTNTPFISTTLRASYVQNPESFDGVTGRVGISNLDGEAIKACFKLRDMLYVVKDSSLYVTQDNGSTEPFGWTVSTISTVVGTPSIRGVAVAEEYAFIVNQLGVYMFNGSEPIRVNQEIKPVSGLGQGWDAINWRFGASIWVTLDVNKRHLLIGAPVGESNVPNQIFMMNYRELDESYSVASNKAVHMSYTGKMVSWDMSRKWAMWNIRANCCAVVRRQDLSLQVWFGNNQSNGRAYQLDSSATTDDGAAILSIYYTFFFVNREMEQGLQVGCHRHLYTYLAAFTSGAGVLSLTGQADSLTATRSVALAPRTLSSNPNYDLEAGINFTADRLSIKFATDGQAGSTFFLSKMTMTMKPDPWSPVRGRV